MSIKDGQIPASWSPIFDGWVPLSGFVAPTDYSNPDPQQIDILQKGGHRCVKELTDRDTITEQRRSRGMLVYIFEDPTPSNNWLYQLLSWSNWWVDNDINNNDNRVVFESWSSTGIFVQDFTEADVVWWNVTISHNLDSSDLITQVEDAWWNNVICSIQEIDNNTIILDMSWFTPLVWTYKCKIVWWAASWFNPVVVSGDASTILWLKESWSLVPGGVYVITDYQTIYNQQITNIEKSWPIESITLLAKSESEFFIQWESNDHNDIIHYDPTYTELQGNSVDLEFESTSWSFDFLNENGINSTAISWNTITFSMDNAPISTVQTFFIECEDLNSWEFWEFDDSIDNLVSNWDILFSDNWWNNYTITLLKLWDLGWTIDFDNNDYFFFQEASEQWTPAKGLITYRKDIDNNIETTYDFRGIEFVRYDASLYQGTNAQSIFFQNSNRNINHDAIQDSASFTETDTANWNATDYFTFNVNANIRNVKIETINRFWSNVVFFSSVNDVSLWELCSTSTFLSTVQRSNFVYTQNSYFRSSVVDCNLVWFISNTLFVNWINNFDHLWSVTNSNFGLSISQLVLSEWTSMINCSISSNIDEWKIDCQIDNMVLRSTWSANDITIQWFQAITDFEVVWDFRDNNINIRQLISNSKIDWSFSNNSWSINTLSWSKIWNFNGNQMFWAIIVATNYSWQIWSCYIYNRIQNLTWTQNITNSSFFESVVDLNVDSSFQNVTFFWIVQNLDLQSGSLLFSKFIWDVINVDITASVQWVTFVSRINNTTIWSPVTWPLVVNVIDSVTWQYWSVDSAWWVLSFNASF